MEKLNKEYIQQILGDSECQSGLRCVESGLEELCKAKDIGLKSYLVCLEEDEQCSFALTTFGDENWWCKCPARMYIAREYNK